MKKIIYAPPCYPSASEDARDSQRCIDTPQTKSDAYRLAFSDQDFLLRDELRAVRLQLELTKPELVQQEHGVEATVVVFGSARIPERAEAEAKVAKARQAAATAPADQNLKQELATAERLLAKSRYYDEARRLGQLISADSKSPNGKSLMVSTGGGPGIMEAANRGACDVGAKSIGHNIVLPFEQRPNLYIAPELCFQFHYFAIRKMHFLIRAKALVAFPGGYGTLDELFETLTLIQTRTIKPLPVLLFGRNFWQRVIDVDFLVEEGVIGPADREIFTFVETAEEAWQAITSFYNHG